MHLAAIVVPIRCGVCLHPITSVQVIPMTVSLLLTGNVPEMRAEGAEAWSIPRPGLVMSRPVTRQWKGTHAVRVEGLCRDDPGMPCSFPVQPSLAQHSLESMA